MYDFTHCRVTYNKYFKKIIVAGRCSLLHILALEKNYHVFTFQIKKYMTESFKNVASFTLHNDLTKSTRFSYFSLIVSVQVQQYMVFHWNLFTYPRLQKQRSV